MPKWATTKLCAYLVSAILLWDSITDLFFKTGFYLIDLLATHGPTWHTIRNVDRLTSRTIRCDWKTLGTIQTVSLQNDIIEREGNVAKVLSMRKLCCLLYPSHGVWWNLPQILSETLFAGSDFGGIYPWTESLHPKLWYYVILLYCVLMWPVCNQNCGITQYYSNK